MRSVIVDNVSKNFGNVTALNGVSFEVEQGELFGLIGPDGAGKTTLFRILTTLMIAGKGNVSVDGFDVVKDFKEIRKRVGYMPGRFSLYQDLTVSENLDFFATLFNTSIEENYDLVKGIYSQIEKFRDRKAGALSGGMKQKLALSCALIHRPSVLFLDEPTTGVDAVSRKEFWELLRDLQKEKITIVVSTPYMDEASLCDRVALIQQGKIMKVDSPSGITKQFGKKLWSFKSNDMYRLMQDLEAMPDVESCYPFGSEHHVVLKAPVDSVKQKLSHENLSVHEIEPTIEDCFMDLMTSK